MENNNTTLAVIDKSELEQMVAFTSGSYNENVTTLTKAEDYGNQLLALIKSNGMTDDLAAKCNAYLVRIREASAKCEERRKPLTKLFDGIKSKFTSLEKRFDVKDASTVPAQVQKVWTEHETKKLEEKRKADAEAARKLAIEKEKINLSAEGERKASESFNALLSKNINELVSIFNNLTITGYEDSKSKIAHFPDTFTDLHFNFIEVKLFSTLVSAADINQIIQTSKQSRIESFRGLFRSTISNKKNELMDKLPGKLSELKAQKEAEDKAAEQRRKAELEQDAKRKTELEAEVKRQEQEQERLAKEAEEKRVAEEQRLAKEEQERQENANAEIEGNKQANLTNTLFEHEAGNAVVTAPQTGQINETLVIRLTNVAGYLPIVMFYFKNEGNKKTVAELEKKTLGSMISFAERTVNKTGERIESPYIVYETEVKTSARK